MNSTLHAIGWAGAILIPLAIAYAFRRAAVWMNVVAAVWVIGLSVFADQRAELMIYAWCAIGSAGMIAWGIYEFRAERINLGMAGFAITIIAFFFSSVMDKLGRSASLIALGALLLAGGWQWEKLRRRLLTQVRAGRCAMTLLQKGLILAGAAVPDGAEPDRQAALRSLHLPAGVGENGAVRSRTCRFAGGICRCNSCPKTARRISPKPTSSGYCSSCRNTRCRSKTARFKANAPELWAEVTIPHAGPPRPIRLGLKKAGKIEPIEVN